MLIDEEGIALRGLFIIDPNGILRVMSINDLPIGRSVDETLRLIKALQFVEKHGEGKNFIFSLIVHESFWHQILNIHSTFN